MAASLWRFWQQTGALREARQWLTDLGRARELYQQAVELYRTLGDRRGMADA